MIVGWRVMSQQGATGFVRDEIELYIAHNSEEGYKAAEPISITLSAPIDIAAGDAADIKPSIIPKELAERLFESLGYTLLGISEPYREIKRLNRELVQERARVDALIKGIERWANGDAPK